jgi:hypothetical protein
MVVYDCDYEPAAIARVER